VITIHTCVTNPLYFLFIKLYKIILYSYYIRTHSHKSPFTGITFQHNNNNNNNNAHNQYQTHTHNINL